MYSLSIESKSKIFGFAADRDPSTFKVLCYNFANKSKHLYGRFNDLKYLNAFKLCILFFLSEEL